MQFKVISFYKYIKVKGAEKLRLEVKRSCEKLGLMGRILVSQEGINGAVSGEAAKIETFKNAIRKNKIFSGLTFREQGYQNQTYHKLVVKTRDEIVRFGKKANLKRTGKHISPKNLKAWLDKKQDIILLDARNQYETKIGKFKGAITLPIENFRDFPKASKKLSKFRDKKIVMYCTGGVRCEKASAFLKQEGFKDVYQIQGGIINFVNQYPDTYFEGSCFVFDDRLVSRVSSNKTSKCEICGDECDEILNCFNLDCDKLFVSCKKCQKRMNKTCSEDCKNSKKRRKETNF
ncbi:MAG: rhodanese-related sulfurtransferase [Candidatus Aenigmarchaeota archaeon]|nr:rhodanese-related sulfurtransferase [Candidatus Aenigmarchaeota archaeon]